MGILSGSIDFFGLDLGSSGIRIVELGGSGPVKVLKKYAFMPIEGSITRSDSPTDQQKVAGLIKDLITKSTISTKNVAVGLYSQKVFTTVFETDRLPKTELEKALKYQADAIIPTPIAESKVDWEILGDSPKDTKKVEILLSSVTNAYLESQLSMLESIGLNVIAFEPDSMAASRALVGKEDKSPQVVIDFGSISTDLTIVDNSVPYLTRSIPMGATTAIKTIMQSFNVDQNQASQFLYKFGMAKDKLEGKLFTSLEYPIDSLLLEIDKSIKYYLNRYQGKKIEKIIISGSLSMIPEIGNYMAAKLGISIEIGNAWRNIVFDKSKANELMSISGQFAVAAGLAERMT